ncbi:MAG TPA: nucleotide sugar dehydrogenase [Pseudolabrys sp.]|nr:nucleotide sugar dehydrogenase [Pseudolabrys sp.]
MRAIVIGLGHVGIVTAADLLRDGHSVIGLDTNQAVQDYVGRGLSPIHEPGVAELVAAGHAAGRLVVTADPDDAAQVDIAIVCVGTRGRDDGTLDLTDVTRVAGELGRAARKRPASLAPLLMVFRSTTLPGAMAKIVLPAIAAAAGEPPGARYEAVYHPTFTREGNALADAAAPSRVVIGERTPGSARLLREILNGIEAPVFATSFEVAELTKLADNTFHALKVSFANEIGRFAVQSGISPGDVFDCFRADGKLNLSASYLRPGGAFGGPCLPKDVRALAEGMREADVAAPIIERILDSNARHTDFLIAEIEKRVRPPGRVLLVGLSFKNGTDDLRASPFVRLAEMLLDRGHALSIYDSDIAGDAADVMAQLPPRIAAAVLPRLAADVAWDLVVLGKEAPEALCSAGKRAVFRIDRL